MPRRRPNRTRKAAAKRFKISATGKVMHYGAGKRHLNAHKSSKQKRRLSQKSAISKSHEHHIIDALPFSHRG